MAVSPTQKTTEIKKINSYSAILVSLHYMHLLLCYISKL